MANHSATKKAIRRTVRKTVVNKTRLSGIRTYIKKVEQAIEAGDAAVAREALVKAQSQIMKGVSHNIIKKNTASRKVSRLSELVKAIGGASAKSAPAVKYTAVKSASKAAPEKKEIAAKKASAKKPAAKKADS